ncbi:MAG: 23S rRNA (uracil(1939)-C(5))-methyltransferase RlmD [Lachnospiraceae bacterium]|nr:23S rRNA (uracil(1939)-C(5))-methyltransferase RlmD [Lachnospiraceae bacterium]
MKKGDEFEGKVIETRFPQTGVIETLDGTRILMKKVLPGQRVRGFICKKKAGLLEGRLLEVTEKAPNEVEPPCPHFGTCGGCAYLNLSYEDAIALKEQQVYKLLSPVFDRQERDWTWEGIKASPSLYGYRNKMEFTFGDAVKDGPLELGMHRSGNFYDIITVDQCRIMDGDYRKILAYTRDFFAEHQIPHFHRLSHIGYLRHLLVRKGWKSGEILIGLVTSSQMEEEKADPVLSAWRDGLLSLETEGTITGILHILNDAQADAVLCDRMDILYGRDYIQEELLDLSFKVSTFSFFQTNSAGAELLYETARRYITEAGEGKGGVVFDLYSGTGTIAQMMASAADEVVGVEIVEEAVEAARESAKANGLTNCRFLAGDVLKVLDEIEEKPDLIILDPPRDGVHPKALRKIMDYGVKHLIYISCKPTSLARDGAILLENGYEAVKAVACDQFPWTSGVESIALFERKEDPCS